MGAVIEQVLARGRHLPGMDGVLRPRPLDEPPSPTHGFSLEDAVYRHRTEHEVLPWDHLSAGLHRDFLWQDWWMPLATHGLEDCRWTPCYDCGACTGFGIEHVVASAVPPAGGSQGTGQDLSIGGQVPVRFLTTAPSGAGSASGGENAAMPWSEREEAEMRVAFASPSSARFASPASVTGSHVGAGPAPGRASLAYSSGFSPRPQLSFGLALPTGCESLAEYLDVALDADRPGCRRDVASLPARADRAPPDGIAVEGRSCWSPATAPCSSWSPRVRG